jgi:hypothetical protein
MRTALLAYLTANLTGSIRVSSELPYEEGGAPLNLKNLRRVYLNEPTTEVSQLLGTFDSDILEKITTVSGVLSTDAKQRNTDLDSALVILAAAKNTTTITNSFRNEFDYTTEIDAGIITYTFEYRFHTID